MNTGLPLILAAEDEETDAFLLRLAFDEAHVTNPVVVVSDGQEVVNYLTGSGAYSAPVARPLPRLITLDLKMPRMNGFDVLDWLKGHPEFNAIPVVVISSSSEDRDMVKARSLGARDYFVKPHRLEDFIAIIHSLQKRWLGEPAAT